MSERINSSRLLNTGATIAACLVAALAPIACIEERVVRYDPILGGLPGSESGSPIVKNRGDYVDPTIVPDQKIVLEDEKGKKTLIARTGRHLMSHIYTTLHEGDKKLFTDQVLSARTKKEYFERGRDPGEAFDLLTKRINDVDRLFDAMPGGEYTPGVFLTPVGGGVQRFKVDGVAARGLRWTGIDMVMEGGNWKLRWFVTPESRR